MRKTLTFGLVALTAIVWTTAAVAANPKEATGFFGTVTGTVKSANVDGTSFVLAVKEANPDAQSAVKDTAAMIGKVLTIGVRMPRDSAGAPHPHPDDTAYVKTLKPGMDVSVHLFAVKSDPTVLRIQSPGVPATKPSN